MFLVSLFLACTGELSDSATAGPNAPEVYLLAPAADSVWEPLALIPVTGVLVDDGTAADQLDLSLSSDRDGVVATPALTGDGQLAATVTLSAGPHVLTLSAEDAAGHRTDRSVSIVVADVARPSQPSVRVDPEAPVTGDTLVATLVAPSVDPLGGTVSYAWSWVVDGTPTEHDDVRVPGDQVVAGQTWTVTLTATNGETLSTPASRTVTVTNAPPAVAGVTLSPTPPTATTALTCAAGPVDDREGDPYTQAWTWEVNGRVVGGVDPSLPAGTALRGDVVRCGTVLTAEDGRIVTAWSAAASVDNLPPTLGSVALTPTRGDVTTPFTCAAHGPVDPDLDVVNVYFTWWAGSTLLAEGPTLPPGTPRGTALTCSATPTDGLTEGPTLTSSPVVLDNAPPSAPRIVDLGDVAAGSPAACGVATLPTDPDGDPVALTWTWEADGAVVPADGPVLPTTGLDAGVVLTCTATPDDGRALGPSDSAALALVPPTRGTLTSGEARIVLEGSAPGGQFGKVVDDVPDLDGDGYAELLVGAPRGDGGTRGAVYLFTSSTLAGWGSYTDLDADAAWYGHGTTDQLGGGRGAAGAADVDGDALGDLLAAAPQADAHTADGGEVYLLSGGGQSAWGADVSLSATAGFYGDTGDWLGVRVAAGDLDGDGLADLMLAAPYRDAGGDRTGSVLVWFGGAGLVGGVYGPGDADAEITGARANDQLGWSLAWSADGNGDGYGELVTGVFLDDTNGTDAGSAAVISGDDLDGRAAYEGAAWRVVRGTHAGDRCGYDVASPGDVDGDGLADLLVGAYLADEAGADAGSATLWFGRAGINQVVDADAADTTFLGLAAGDLLGGALDGAGDFDGDGLADLLFGAARADTDAGETGRAWLHLGASLHRGGAILPVSGAAVEMVGPSAGSWFGDEVAGGLDVDGDGYGELVVGAQGADGDADGSGVVWVYEGP